ncbi:MAG: hypothetical protein HKN80_04635 [Acidimicrobiia bacterium]|nr:hypothetical protein [Acidimicrobiia bacterium]
MMKRLLILALMALSACSGGSPTVVDPPTPSTILLPAEPAPDSTTMFIGELRGFAINEGNTWVAAAEVTILDGEDEPVTGVLISGKWDEGETDTTACTTVDAGTCELESGSIRKRVGQAVLEITHVEHDVLNYDRKLDLVDEPEDQPRELTIRKP